MDYPFSQTWWIEDAQVLGGRYPGTPDAVERKKMLGSLLDSGFALLINLQQPDERGAGGRLFHDYAKLLEELAGERGQKAEVRRYPIPDASIPSPDLMREILDKIDAAMEAGGKVYVHCWGGHGRTAVVAGCWLVRHGLSSEEALERIAQSRKHDNHLAGRASPETTAQRQFIMDWPGNDREIASPASFSPSAAAHADSADRAMGALIGLAVGDAVGTTVEFKRPGSFTPMTDMIGGGPFHLQPGEWTDDTSMALCLAESLVESNGFDPADQMHRYSRWWKEGHLSVKNCCFDIGATTQDALARHLRTGKTYTGSVDPHSAGNGALMRLAPVPMAYAHKPSSAITFAGESSRTTHGARESIDSCRYLAGLLVGLINGRPKEEVLSPLYTPVAGLWTIEPLAAKVEEVAKGSFKCKQPPAVRGSGYVVDCLEAALWAFAAATSFEEAILAAVNLGDDADTTAAVCGQIAGACYGVSGIPARWRQKLAMRQQIETLGKQLVSLWPSD